MVRLLGFRSQPSPLVVSIDSPGLSLLICEMPRDLAGLEIQYNSALLSLAQSLAPLQLSARVCSVGFQDQLTSEQWQSQSEKQRTETSRSPSPLTSWVPAMAG